MNVARRPQRRPTLGAALRNLKDRFFVGRRGECRLFADCLAGAADEWRILNVYGPGGVGKSTLLDAFRRLAERSGALYVYLDARDIDPTPQGLVDRLARALDPDGRGDRPTLEDCLRAIGEEAARRPVVLAFDTYEEMAGLDRWLREALLARLPARALVVVSGRFPLRGAWQESPAWRRLVHPLPLAPFDISLTREYLRRHGVEDDPLVRATWDFTRGIPLALSLAAALAQAPDRPEVLTELARRWLREVTDERLRPLVEAAATVRRFDLDLLALLTGGPVDEADFDRLTALSFVRAGPAGWSLHDLLRTALARELRRRSPTAFQAMRRRAMGYHARLATLPGGEADRAAALEELFYMLGDDLIRAAFFGREETEGDGLQVVPAEPADLPALRAYMDEWRRAARDQAATDVELVDRESRSRFRHVVTSDHNRREPELVDPPGLLALEPAAVRMLKDADGRLRGISIVIPVNGQTLDYLTAQPVTGHFFRRLDPRERSGYAAPAGRAAAWFIRLIDLRDPADLAGRAALLRDLLPLIARGGRYLASTPLPFYQELLRRFGFTEVPGADHLDYGPESPSPTYILDLRGRRLAAYLARLSGAATTDAAALAPTGDPSAPDRSASVPPGLPAGLTGRERDVTQGVLDGLSNAQIAARLHVSEITVKKTLSRVFEKFGVASRTQLIKRLLGEPGA